MIVTLPANKYDQIQEIARGGMGIVFKAHHKYLHRWTAVKVLYPHLAADAGFIERFKREARTMARLDHDGIIRIYDVEPGEETYCLVMEYVEGQDLKRVQRARGALPSGAVVEIALQIAEALAYAHSVGVVHRDIKPGNILVGSDSRVKVGDFGIAAALDEMAVTTSGQILGTPEYMAPEQLHGGPVDGRTDLYALGMTMAALAIGQSPFHNRPRAAVLAELTMLAEHALAWPPTVPPDLQAVIERLVKKRPADRYQGAQDLVEDLRRLAQTTRSAGQSVPVPSGAEESPTEDLRRAETEPGAPPTKARGRWPKVAAGIAALVVVGLGLVWGLRGMGPGSAREQTARLKDAKNAVEVTHDRMKVAREAAKEAEAERFASALAKAGAKAEAEGDRGRQEASALIATSRDTEARGSLERAATSYGAAEAAYRQAAEASLKGRPPERTDQPAVAGRGAPERSRPAPLSAAGEPAPPQPPATQPVALPPSSEPPDLPTQPTLDDVEAVTARLETVRVAAARRDLEVMREALDVAPSHERLLAQLFTEYREIRLAVGQVQIGRGVATARLTFERLVNQAGQEVVPADSWRVMEVRLDKRGGAWGLPRW